MFKKYLAIFFLSFSTIMMLGHSIIPHHHFEDATFSSVHFHTVHSDASELNHHIDFLTNAFSLVSHGQKGMECISCPNMDETFNKQYFDFAAVIPFSFEVVTSLAIFQNRFFEYAHKAINTQLLRQSGLRGPPVFS